MTQAEFEAYSKQQIKPMEQLVDPTKMGWEKRRLSLWRAQIHIFHFRMAPPNLMDPTHHPIPSQLPFVPQFNANVSPFALHPPFTAPPWNNWQAHAPNDPSKIFNDSKIDPKILAKASEWTEHRAPDGRPYFYNASRAESTWERPQALKELDEARNALSRPMPMQPQPMTSTQGNITFDSSGNMVNAKQRQAELEAEKERKRKEEEKAKQAAKPQDKSRPVSSTSILGTPWCVVWTGDSRVFYYNPSTRNSVWERPEDLVGKSSFIF